jgi:hypothetical protein
MRFFLTIGGLCFGLPCLGHAAQGDQVAGAGVFTAADGRAQVISVAAMSGPAGEDPRGSINIRIPGLGEATIDVTCMFVQGNRAAVGGPVRSGDIALPGYNWIAVVVEDNGNGPSADRVVSIFSFIPLPCELFVTGPFIDIVPPIEAGNFMVRDASP